MKRPQEDWASVKKEEIIFFDTLGLGWVVDMRIIMEVFSADLNDEPVNERQLLEHTLKQSGQA